MQYSKKQVEFFREHLKTDGGVEVFVKHLLQYGQQNVHTPFSLCQDMISKLDECTSLNDKQFAVLFNLEFLHILVRKFGVPQQNITMFADDMREFEFCRGMYPDVHLFVLDITKTLEENKLYTTEGEVMKKFDVQLGNPPYQQGDRKHGGVCAANILWDKFVIKAYELLNQDGYLVFIHPSLWRKPGHKIQEIIKGNKLLYLEIHSEKDGLKTFGAETRYDWYVLKKSSPEGLTVIKCQDGVEIQIDISKLDFIPNYDFELYSKLIAENPNDRVELISNSAYHTQRKELIRSEKSEIYCYPCVYTVPKNGNPKFYWSKRNDRGHFGVPKVIWSTGRPISVGFYLDIEGKCGVTQFSTGIVDVPTNLIEIQKALNGEKFRSFCAAISIGKLEINHHIMKYFRKDFWKEFI